MITRAFPNLLCPVPTDLAPFYETLLDFQHNFSADWFILLEDKENPDVTLGLLQQDHGSVPQSLSKTPSGQIITFVVPDCDVIHDRLQAMSHTPLTTPTDMEYGQRRMLVKDPIGAVIDISAPTAAMPGR